MTFDKQSNGRRIEVESRTGCNSALLVTRRVTGCSFSTLSGRSWRHLQAAGVYELTYRNCGELLAVVVGYLLLLQHVSLAALLCRSVGQHVDLLTSGTVSNWTATTVGGLAPLDSRLDPVGAALAVLVVPLSRVEPPEWLRRRRIWLAAAMTAVVLATLLFVFVVALFHLHFDNWTGADNFFPHGLRGVRFLTRAACRQVGQPSAAKAHHTLEY